MLNDLQRHDVIVFFILFTKGKNCCLYSIETTLLKEEEKVRFNFLFCTVINLIQLNSSLALASDIWENIFCGNKYQLLFFIFFKVSNYCLINLFFHSDPYYHNLSADDKRENFKYRKLQTNIATET